MSQTIHPVEIASMLAEVGVWGDLHDHDLNPMEAKAAERDLIVHEFRNAGKEHGIMVPRVTVSLRFLPIPRRGAFTANHCE
jgi:xylose isomerase